jgi:hypothetical protein
MKNFWFLIGEALAWAVDSLKKYGILGIDPRAM